MKLATRIVTGLAVLGLAAPVLAAEATPAKQPAPVAQTQKHRHARKVAQSTEKKAEPKAEKKAPAKAEKAPAKSEQAPAKAEPAPAKAEKTPTQPSK